MSSQRTKRRKISAVVAKLVEEASLNNKLNHDLIVQDNMIDDNSYVCSDTNESLSKNNITEFYDTQDWLVHSNDDSDNEQIEQLNPNDNSLADDLGKWAASFKISHIALDSLLQILRKNGSDLPKDSRSLLHTKRKIESKTVAGGEYYYIGLQYWLSLLLKKSLLSTDLSIFTIHINIDGIPLFNNSNITLWPILGSFKELDQSIFPIALFSSSCKPKSVDNYLKDFIDEMKCFQEVGVICDNTGKAYKIKLEAVICDAPARSFVKCIKTHNGYNCCERCIQRGEWYQKIVLPDLSAPLRTDLDFFNQLDSEHHNAVSPFTNLNYNMVSGFPIDYMHCVCLGVVRRIINLWIQGPPSCRLSQNIVVVISEKLAALQPYISKEFSRKSRSLAEFRRWNATELRLFLIYTGPVVLKGKLLPNYYQNFMDLSVAVRILLCTSLLKHYAGYASQLLRYFVQTFEELYGRDQLVIMFIH